MSDEDKDKPEGADGFTPAPPPPQLSEEEAGIAPATETASADGEPAAGETLPEGSVHVPQDTAKRALEAVQILVENNRSASQQLESLMSIVLDAAEVANRSASHVTTTGGQLNKAAEKLIDGAQKTSMQSKIVLALAAAVLVGCGGTFSFIAVQLQSKVEQLDEMMLAVGKRAVDLKRRMESMDDISSQLAELNLKQENTQSVQQAIEDKIATIVELAKNGAPKKTPAPEPAPAGKPSEPAKKTEKSEKQEKSEAQKKAEADTADAKKLEAQKKAEAEAAAAKRSEALAKAEAAKAEAARARAEAAKAEAARAEAANKALLQQLAGLDALLKEQSKSVKDLNGQVSNLNGSVQHVEALKKEVESLSKQQAQQEKQRALEAERAAQELAAANARRERELKEKERELARERDRAKERELAREREAAKERELAREREAAAAREREAAISRERELAKEREKEAKAKEKTVAYNREQSRPSGNVGNEVPAYSKPAVAKPE